MNKGAGKYHIRLDDMMDGILIGSHEGFIIDANNVFCVMSGRSRESLIGNHISNLMFTEESIDQTPFRFDLLQTGEIVMNEREMICENGTVISIEMRTKMMPDGTYQSFYRDVYELKTKEIKLQEQVNELINLNSDKNKFIAVLAHDLINPFNAILGLLDVVSSNMRTYDIDTLEKYIHIVQKSSKNTYNLLQDTLSWSEVESNRFKVEPQNLIFSTICDEVIGKSKHAAISKNISIECMIAKELLVFADRKMLKIVLRNLISNAIKFTNNGGAIKISANQMNSDVIVTVSDNGVGVAPEILHQLFDITKKITTAGTENEKGTGLGLILCKEFVEKQKGKIWVESEVGNGSDFKFSLPN
jgi:PAS domain S-box-containing protein